MQSSEHQCTQVVPAWTGFNQSISKVSPAVTTVAYLLIIPSPAHEWDTIFTVLLRCKRIALKLGQKTTVVTFDEALNCKAKELVWANPLPLTDIVIRLGGFHAAKNYLGAIGKHMEDSGLFDAWTESGLYNECTANKILAGQSWNRAVRGHKLTLEAVWRILLKEFRAWQTQKLNTSFEDLVPFGSRNKVSI